MVESASFNAALSGMVNRPFLNSQRQQEYQWRAKREGAHEGLLDWEKAMIARMAKAGVPMFAHCVIRTNEEQLRLYREGMSKDSPADGLWPHMAYAADIVHSALFWALDRRQWALVGHMGKELAIQRGIALTWGGDWKFYDPAHWEVTNWKELERKRWSAQ